MEGIMKKCIARWLIAGLAGLLTACAIITVNVYFPEKDVKQAYKSLDEMLLKQETPPAPESEPKGEEGKPVSLLPSLQLVATAHAQDNLADDLTKELANIPEVQKAYGEMRARLPQLNALRDSGIVGETANGSVAVRDPAKTAEVQAMLQAENANRKIVIVNMAKAVLRLNKQPETKDALNDAVRKAATLFADAKREEAKAGWWLQNAAGRWVQK
jgi:uncharacterized protein YdbL (DUF1318 family)